MADVVENVLRPALLQLDEPGAANDAKVAQNLKSAADEIAAITGSRLPGAGYDTPRPALADCAAFLGHRASQTGVSVEIEESEDLDVHAPETPVVGQIAFNLVASAIPACAEGSVVSLGWTSDAERRGLTLTARNSDRPVLAAELDEPTSIVSDRVQALAARSGAIMEIDPQDPSKLIIACRFPCAAVAADIRSWRHGKHRHCPRIAAPHPILRLQQDESNSWLTRADGPR